MALMRSFFKGQSKSNQIIPLEEEITLESLKKLIPIRNLSDEKLQSFALEHKAKVLPVGEILFKCNESANAAIYLLKGTVSLSDSNGKTFEITSTDAKGKFPLSSGLKHTTTATSKSEVSVLHVSQKIMSINSEDHKTELVIPENLKNSPLLQSFAQHFYDDELDLPSLPNVAIQLRKAMQKEIGVDEAVKIIQLDPVISAKLIEVANCPLYVAASPARSCFEAVKRIGLNSTRSLVISLSVKNVFKSKSPLIKKHLDQIWKDSLYLSSLSYVLASVCKQKSPEEALLAGLICDIGAIPFLNFVANLPADYYDDKEIQKIIPVVKGIVGAAILKKWDFPDDFIEVPLMSENWFHSTDNESLSCTDIVMLSKLHRNIGKKDKTDLPAITSIPAASKLKNMTLSPENSLNILHNAKHKINDALKSFSS